MAMPFRQPTSQPLLSHQSFLKELVVYVRSHQHISLQHPAGKVMRPMRQLVSLKQLGLPAWWMVHSTAYKQKRVDEVQHSAKLVEMLPPKLGKLQIQLEELRLHCRNQAYLEYISRIENVAEHYSMILRWHSEIAVWKQSYIQRLKEAVVSSLVPRLLHEEVMIQESKIKKMFQGERYDDRVHFLLPGHSRVVWDTFRILGVRRGAAWLSHHRSQNNRFLGVT